MSGKLLSEAIEEYANWRRDNRRMKDSTLKGQASHMRIFLASVGDQPVAKITSDKVDKSVAARRHVSPAVINQYQSTLDGFFAYARSKRWCPGHHNPTGHLLPHKVVERERVHIPADMFPDVLDATRNQRDRAIVAVALCTFVRASEARTIRISDVDLEEGRIRVIVHKGGGFTDPMPISQELDEELRRWLAFYQASCGALQPDWLLLPGIKSHATGVEGRASFAHPTAGRKLTLYPDKQFLRPDRLAQQAIVDGAGVELRDPITGKSNMEGMHTLRRSGARALFDDLCEQSYDGALRIVQAMLHHKQSSTTERYLGLDLDKARRDKLVAGRRMFPSKKAATVGDNVIPLRAGVRK